MYMFPERTERCNELHKQRNLSSTEVLKFIFFLATAPAESLNDKTIQNKVEHLQTIDKSITRGNRTGRSLLVSGGASGQQKNSNLFGASLVVDVFDHPTDLLSFLAVNFGDQGKCIVAINLFQVYCSLCSFEFRCCKFCE